jgi:hypothetical protein
MDIETLALRLEEIRLSRIEVLEKKKVLAEELLARGLKVELKKGILENMSLLIQLDLTLNDAEILYENLIECRILHARYRQQSSQNC